MRLDRACLPKDIEDGAFAARVMTAEGPVVVGLLRGAAFDMTPAFGTMARWMEEEHPAAAIRTRGAPLALDLAALVANSAHDARDPAKPWLLAPVDLHAVKAAGVTYVRSMLERVIEERCRGDASLAAAVRIEVRDIIGDDLASLVPGSA
jgi:fumarylacetoacetate (FAA) hydrolase family protein